MSGRDDGIDRRPLAVVLLSGGMDSAVAAGLTARDHRLACLHVTYGQRTANRERVSFGALAHHFRAVQRRVVDLAHLGALGGSSLTDPALPVPDAELERAGIPSTYVPFRNAHLLALAVSWAEILGAGQVVLGAVEDDSSGYPDCRRSFMQAFQDVIREGTRPGTAITLSTPVIHMSKAAIVRRGMELGTPFHLTWSCYRDEARACGRCDSCALRLRAFAAAGVEDPIPYRPGATVPPPAPEPPAPAADADPAAGRRQRHAAALRDFLDRVRRF